MSSVERVQKPRRGRDAPRPDWIDIGGRLWEIRWHASFDEFRATMSAAGFSGDMTDMAACTNHHGLTIEMCTEIHLQIQRENLLHEIMHAALFGIKADSGEEAEVNKVDWEEHYISMLDVPVLYALKRNPHVLAWLMAG